VGLFGRRQPEPISIESEHERLRAVRMAAEQELGMLRRELAERVAAVEQRERELSDALARANRSSGRKSSTDDDEAVAHAQVGLAAHAQELNRRENDLEARERAYLKMEADLARRAAGAAETPEERLAHIEARLVALQEAEKAFARTQAELAALSEELAGREAELAEGERSRGVGTPITSKAELAEIDERLRRLERETRPAPAERGFGDSLRALEQNGLRGAPPRS
jgi:DNA repair exonuclease SbcCD ATPase subunit